LRILSAQVLAIVLFRYALGHRRLASKLSHTISDDVRIPDRVPYGYDRPIEDTG
jgi:hypothetical protein